MKLYRTLFLIAILIAMLLPSILLSKDNLRQTNTFIYSTGEELLYEVSWSGIKIGTIKLKSLSDLQDSRVTRHKAVAYIDSYSGLPFVNVHLIAYTEMDSGFNSLGSYSFEKQDEGWQKLAYLYNMSEKIVFVEESFQDDLDSSPQQTSILDTIRLSKIPIQDGISLVFLGRRLSQVQESFLYPTVANVKLGETEFHSLRPQTKVKIKAWKKPIRVVELSGKLKLEGIFGLTGDFRGWFSDDNASIPITAEMKVILGSVKIELIKWKHQGWKPPE